MSELTAFVAGVFLGAIFMAVRMAKWVRKNLEAAVQERMDAQEHEQAANFIRDDAALRVKAAVEQLQKANAHVREARGILAQAERLQAPRKENGPPMPIPKVDLSPKFKAEIERQDKTPGPDMGRDKPKDAPDVKPMTEQEFRQTWGSA